MQPQALFTGTGQVRPAEPELKGSRFIMIVGVTAVLFFLGLLPLEVIPEIPVDIDSKPFFIPLALIALLPAGRPGLAVGLGVALGECIRDMMEGYELDDPIGFIGYVLGFALTSLMFGKQPPGKLMILIAGLTSAFIQALIEASSFLLFGEESLGIVIQSTLGNTITHGLIWGAIPAFFLIPRLQGRFERHLGFVVKGQVIQRPQLLAQESDFIPQPGALAWLKDVYFYYPSSIEPVLKGISLDLRPGEVLGLMGPSHSGKSTLCRVLADVAPHATGGDLIGLVELGARAVEIGYVTDNPAALMTRTRAIQEVEASLEHLELTSAEIRSRADAALNGLGFSAREAQAYVWELPIHRQMMVALAAAIAEKPRFLILDEVADMLDAGGMRLLDKAIAECVSVGAGVLLVDNDWARQAQWSDRIMVLEDGAVSAVGATREVLADPIIMARLGIARSEARDAPPRSPQTHVEAVLVAEDLHCAPDGEKPVLRDASFTLGSGEVLGIAGANGSGKTTLARLLGGLANAQRGTITLHGEPVGNSPDPDRIGVATHSTSAFFSEPTVRAEIAYALRNAELSQRERDQRIASFARDFGIADLLDQDPGLLPPGPARLAHILALLIRGAQVLVLDEASTGMDPGEQRSLVEAIRQFTLAGGSAIVLDHNLDFLTSTADRLLVLDRGKLRSFGPAQQAFAEARRADLLALDLVPPGGAWPGPQALPEASGQ